MKSFLIINLDTSPSASILKTPSSPVSPNSESILQRINDYLKLNGNPKKDEIISTLLNDGRQGLFQYKEYLIPEIFSTERNYI